MDFSQKLKQLMDERKVTAYKVASDIHCSPTSVRNWLSGFSTPQPRTIMMLCNYFEISENELMGRPKKVQKNNPGTVVDAEAQKFYEVFRKLPDSMRSKLLELSSLYLTADSSNEENQ